MSNDPLIDAMVNGIDLSVLKLTDDDVFNLRKEMINHLLFEIPEIWCWQDYNTVQYEYKNLDGDLFIEIHPERMFFVKRHQDIIDKNISSQVVLHSCLFIANKIKGGTQQHNDSIYN